MSKKLYRATVNVTIFVVNAWMSTFIEWQIVLYPFLIKVLGVTVIFRCKTMTSFFDTLTAYECLWWCYFTFLHTKLLMMSRPNTDDTGIRVLLFQISIWQLTSTLAYILTQNCNALAYHLKNRAKCFVSVLHIGMDMTFIDIHRQFLPNGTCLNTSNCK